MWPGRTILVTLLSALPARAPRKASARKRRGSHRSRRARRDARHVATWTTNAATF